MAFGSRLVRTRSTAAAAERARRGRQARVGDALAVPLRAEGQLERRALDVLRDDEQVVGVNAGVLR